MSKEKYFLEYLKNRKGEALAFKSKGSVYVLRHIVSFEKKASTVNVAVSKYKNE